jgi:cytochrome c peroxidase
MRLTWTISLLAALSFRNGIAQAVTPNTGMADPASLITAFDQYAASLASVGGGHILVVPLTTFRGITIGGFNAGGSVAIDLTTGLVTSKLTGMATGGSFDLWFVDNRPAPGHTTLAESRDTLLRVGTYSSGAQAGVLKLSLMFSPVSSSGFLPDRVFVVRSDQTPLTSFALMGSATIFDRLFHRQVRLAGDPGDAAGFDPRAPGRELNFARLVAQGRQVFVKEKFDGNGRACGTCHVENHNFTIDPDFIATLPHTDPLFVAENNPSLAAGFEKPDLMRRFGLFIENADGFDDLQGKFTMRSAQTVLALRNSSVRPDPSFGIDFTSNGQNADPPERLGWSNDGPPIRDFALVAIVQHNTRTLNRRAGADFRVPTDEELDALAAYQLALGRQEDFDLKSLQLKSALASKGKSLFLDTGNIAEQGHKNCNACHFNAGGTTGIAFNSQIPGFSPRLDGNPRGFNGSAPVNVNETPLALSLGLPRDGGFGVLPTPLGGFGNFAAVPAGLFPIEEFNAPALVEAADTAPFFHNHSVPDLESAVAFYGTPAFKDSPSSIGGPIGLVFVKISPDPNDPEVQAIAAFLRVLNALENIRSSISLVGRAKGMAANDDARDLAGLALAETKDAVAVLSAGALARSTEAGILSARAHLIAALLLLEAGAHLPVRPALDIALDQAASSLRAARSALADTSTLPGSYRK